MNIASILGSLMDGNAVGAVSDKLNIPSDKVSSVLVSAIPVLLQNMQNNSSTESGASSLMKAMDDHSVNLGSITDMIKGVDLNDGAKILQHILGGNTSSVLSGLASKNGISSSQVSSILAAIAPSLLSLLGNAKGSGNSSDALGALLGSLIGGKSGGSSILGGLGRLFGKK